MELWIGREILGKCLSGIAAIRVTAPERLPLVLSLSQAGKSQLSFLPINKVTDPDNLLVASFGSASVILVGEQLSPAAAQPATRCSTGWLTR